MNRFVLGLLKLLLQLVLYAFTGQWIRIGEPKAKPRPQPKAPPRVPRPRTEVPRRAARSVAKAPRLLEPQPFLPEPPSLEWLAQEGGSPRARPRRPARGVALPTARPRSLAADIRDPRTLRDALIVGALLAPRRPRS